MKKYILILIIIQFSLFAQSQTLKETQDWLHNKIESYGGFSREINRCMVTFHVDCFKFVNNGIIIKEIKNLSTVVNGDNASCDIVVNSSIIFNKILTIEVSKSGIEIRTYGNQISQKSSVTNISSKPELREGISSQMGDANYNKNISSYFMEIDFSKEANLKERFIKATNRLLTFIPKQKKEAF